ncbi:hypothetical protein AUJ66_01835 [Candidatus Desantisbacteria bacterium CG1_02_38_46]|nr:MAG: hypothetical protein AUJ66_01835 [Candidatus Desantisbacteria bacterium CG1_02_38_46]
MEERRKKILVDRKIQLRYMRTIIVLLVLFAVALGISNYVITGFVLRVSQLGQYAEARFYQVYNRIVYLIILEIVIFIILAAVISVFTSHRFAGPVSRIKEAMNAVKSGNFNYRIKIRKGDDLTDVVNEFNEMLDGLQEKNKPVSS